ncbi:hypothetical protein, partial [Klebsiella pneumoniae]|uniref:hypothetical protein n=1 Tax=Klebsiella pneumoniae TaxID=573 RepID=UPI00210968B5
GTAKVPFPATLSFITRSGTTQTYDAGCDDSWRDMTDALWLTAPSAIKETVLYCRKKCTANLFFHPRGLRAVIITVFSKQNTDIWLKAFKIHVLKQ